MAESATALSFWGLVRAAPLAATEVTSFGVILVTGDFPHHDEGKHMSQLRQRMDDAMVLRGLADRARAAEDGEALARVVAAADHVMAEENDDWWITLGGQAPAAREPDTGPRASG